MNESSSFASISEDQNSISNVKTHRLNDDNSLMEEFLENARYGNIEKVVEIVEQKSLEVKNFKINYRGIHKRFYGWTALHLSCYFNQTEVVRYLLKQPDIDINITNNENDTPLHKAVHSSINSSRYNIVELLLLNNADITLKNNQGLRPIDLASDPSVKSLIEAAEKTENYNLQKQFFEAVIANDLDLINKLLVNKNFDLNCTDTFGNTALHIASNKNRCEIAILLIEKGISTIVQNQQKLTALDFAKTKEMKEIIGYVPYNHRKYQGFLLKKRKFLGYKEYFVVLNKGYIIYYSNEIDAAKDHNRKGTYFLNNAIIREYADNGQEDYLAYSWTILYTNGKKHTLCSLLPYKRKNNGTSEHAGFRSHIKEKTRSLVTAKRTQLKPIERKKKWIEAIKEHIKYSDSHLGASTNNETQAMPIESLHKYLNALKANEDKLNFLLIQIDQQYNSISQIELNQLNPSSNIYQVIFNSKKNLESLKIQYKNYIDNANKCLSLHDQRDSLLKFQLAESRSKCELLEQSLRVIAQENFELESGKMRLPEMKMKTATSSELSAKASVDDDNILETTMNLSLAETDQNEEFFDPADDPLTDEENKDDANENEDFDNKSLAMISCYGSLEQLTTGVYTEGENKIQSQLSLVESKKKEQVDNLMDLIERDEFGWRLRLPSKMFDRSQISIWSILKQFIGKELSKIAMPAALCEPLSFLQRISENVYYSDLLNKAADLSISPDPCKRLEYISAFAVSSISNNIDRLSKPFNPLLGETYELTRDDLGFRIVSEQVSHHPPITAFHTESTIPNNWKYYGTVNPKMKFWGKSIEIQPKGTLTLELNKLNEVYTWQTVTCCVHNIIVGKLWFEYYGTMEIVCHQTGYKAILNFKPYSWSNKELHRVEGFIYDKKKNKVRALYGYWTHCIYSCDPKEYDNYVKTNKKLPMVEVDQHFNEINTSSPNSSFMNNKHIHSESDLASLNNSNLNQTNNLDQNLVTENNRKLPSKKSEPAFNRALSLNAPAQLELTELWRAVPRPSYAADYFHFGYFTMSLNEMKEGFENILAPTDSRYRSDVKELEMGNLDGATREKVKLEEKQRESRKNRKDEYLPKWFHLKKHQYSSEETYFFNNKYWSRDFKDCPDIYIKE